MKTDYLRKQTLHLVFLESSSIGCLLRIFDPKPQNRFSRVRADDEKYRVNFPLHYRNVYQYFQSPGRFGGFSDPHDCVADKSNCWGVNMDIPHEDKENNFRPGKAGGRPTPPDTQNLCPRKQFSLKVTKHQNKHVRAFENTS